MCLSPSARIHIRDCRCRELQAFPALLSPLHVNDESYTSVTLVASHFIPQLSWNVQIDRRFQQLGFCFSKFWDLIGVRIATVHFVGNFFRMVKLRDLECCPSQNYPSSCFRKYIQTLLRPKSFWLSGRRRNQLQINT
jgi:hypothetical protein